jgi:eight-cysteine-cluster-containing protein
MKKTTIHINPPKKEKSIPADEKVTQKKKVATSPNRLPAILVIVTLAIALFIWAAVQSRNHIRINSFETCRKAGYPIMESYPAECAGPDGKTYTEELKTSPSPPPSSTNVSPTSTTQQSQYRSTDLTPTKNVSPQSFHGSALGNCNKDNDCILSGCNKEICQAVGIEPAMSTCEYREDTPLRMGYKCGCVQQECAWRK